LPEMYGLSQVSAKFGREVIRPGMGQSDLAGRCCSPEPGRGQADELKALLELNQPLMVAYQMKAELICPQRASRVEVAGNKEHRTDHGIVTAQHRRQRRAVEQIHRHGGTLGRLATRPG